MPDSPALVHYRCANPKHQDGAGSNSDTLTIHEKQWAYCPHDIRAKGHEWVATGGLPLMEVRRLSKPRTG